MSACACVTLGSAQTPLRRGARGISIFSSHNHSLLAHSSPVRHDSRPRDPFTLALTAHRVSGVLFWAVLSNGGVAGARMECAPYAPQSTPTAGAITVRFIHEVTGVVQPEPVAYLTREWWQTVLAPVFPSGSITFDDFDASGVHTLSCAVGGMTGLLSAGPVEA
jgi:hypothetical protein